MLKRQLRALVVGCIVIAAVSLFQLGGTLMAKGEGNRFPVFFHPGNAGIVVDAKSDEWPATLPFILASDTQLRYGSRSTPKEFNGIIHCFFDSLNMYISGEVTDPTPLKNLRNEGNVHEGDCLEVYLGVHTAVRLEYGEEDYQFGVAMTAPGKKQETYVWKKQAKLDGEQFVTAVRPGGYSFEGVVPLSNFGIESLKEGETLWIDFALDNGEGGENRVSQLVFHGDGTSWKNPSVWKTAVITSDSTKFMKLAVLPPAESVKDKAQWIGVYYKGKPWTGEVAINDQPCQPNDHGMIEFIPPAAGEYKITVHAEGEQATAWFETEDPFGVTVKKDKNLDPFAFFAGKVLQTFSDGEGNVRADDLTENIDRNAKTIRSVTSELNWDYGKGVLKIDSPRSQGASGFLKAAGTIELADIRIISANEYASILVISLDDKPLQSSKKILIQAVTEDKPYGWRDKNGVITSLGGYPANVKNLEASITFKGKRSAGKISVLDENGYVRETVKPEKSDGDLVVKLVPDALYMVLE